MSKDKNDFKIGKVAKLTGISQDRLRVWERRHNAINPQRTDTDRRLYSFVDVERLKLMKLLTDAGDTISRIAQLSKEELQERLSTTQQIRKQTADLSSVKTCLNVVVVGHALEEKLHGELSQLLSLNIIQRHPDIDSLLQTTIDQPVDVLLIEKNTLGSDSHELLSQINQHTHAKSVLLMYRFAPSSVINKLSGPETLLIRAPIEAQDLKHYIMAIKKDDSTHANNSSVKSLEFDLRDTNAIPNRQYDEKTLAKIGAISTTIECECPNHLADLLADINAFEVYSSECEDKDPQQAELHAYLHRSASHARYILEQALTVVMEHEDIEIN